MSYLRLPVWRNMFMATATQPVQTDVTILRTSTRQESSCSVHLSGDQDPFTFTAVDPLRASWQNHESIVQKVSRHPLLQAAAVTWAVKTVCQSSFRLALQKMRCLRQSSKLITAIERMVCRGIGVRVLDRVCKSSGPAMGPTQPPIQRVLGVLSDLTPPISAEVNKTWIYTSTPPIRLHGVVLS
jgi:hypothetical protein